MNIVGPWYELYNDSDSDLPYSLNEGLKQLRKIEYFARISHRSEEAVTAISYDRFLRGVVLSKGDWSVVEHGWLSVIFYVDRGICYDDCTEVLTYDGWKLFADLTESDELACLSDSGNLEWHKSIAIQKYKYCGSMLQFESTVIDLMVTPRHNMWVFDYDKRAKETRTWKFVRANELVNGRYVFTKTCEQWVGFDTGIIIPAHRTKSKAFPSIHLSPELACDLFELLGLWATDGSYQKGYGVGGESIIISQTKVKVCKRIEELCEKLGISCTRHQQSYRIDNGRLKDFIILLFGDGKKTFSVRVPQIIKDASRKQIQRFLDGVMLGDGNTHKENGHQVVYTSSYGFAGDLQELYMKIGLSANIRTIVSRVRNGFIGDFVEVIGMQCKESYVVSICGKKRSTPMLYRGSAKHFGDEVNYKGMVYCATTPYHRLYVRRNGKPVWSGNTHEIVRHRLASFTQESTRFVNYTKKQEPNFIYPEKDKDIAISPGLDPDWEEAIASCEHAYQKLVGKGWAPQLARSVFPNALGSKIAMSCNLRNWRHFLLMRSTREAHPQMRQVIDPLLIEMQYFFPIIFEDIVAGATQADNLKKMR